MWKECQIFYQMNFILDTLSHLSFGDIIPYFSSFFTRDIFCHLIFTRSFKSGHYSYTFQSLCFECGHLLIPTSTALLSTLPSDHHMSVRCSPPRHPRSSIDHPWCRMLLLLHITLAPPSLLSRLSGKKGASNINSRLLHFYKYLYHLYSALYSS
jgi:hypothetical protein